MQPEDQELMSVNNQGPRVATATLHESVPPPDCCPCCGGCCICCRTKPASYKNGLYPIDFRVYNVSFLLYSLLAFYMDMHFEGDWFTSYYYLGITSYYIDAVGLGLIFIASTFIFFVKRESDVHASNTCGKPRGFLYIVGGLAYLAGYVIRVSALHQRVIEWMHPEYHVMAFTAMSLPLLGRAIFVSIHAVFIGYLYVKENRLPQCITCGEEEAPRVPLIRCWTLWFLIYAIAGLLYLVALGGMFWFVSFWGLLVASWPVVLVIALFFNFCCIKRSNEAGGCNSGACLSLTIVIPYYFIVCFVSFALSLHYSSYWSYQEVGTEIFYLFWNASLFVFGALQLWILTRAMHPVAANCGCKQDGSGDGNVGTRIATDDNYDTAEL